MASADPPPPRSSSRTSILPEQRRSSSSSLAQASASTASSAHRDSNGTDKQRSDSLDRRAASTEPVRSRSVTGMVPRTSATVQQPQARGSGGEPVRSRSVVSNPPVARSNSVMQGPRTSTNNATDDTTNDAPMCLESLELGKHVTVARDLGSTQTITYTPDRVIGKGSFGVVFQATMVDTNETVAIKKVLQDRRFKNRELQIMRPLTHPNVVALKHCFYSRGDRRDETYLNLVLEFIPETVHKVVRHYTKQKKSVPLLSVKVFVYQMCRSLAYIHCMGVCHRDIKPQNLLLDPAPNIVKLCDFGSAKMLVQGEPNVSYICSRYYRAPELIFGATDYTTAIDVWSIGCVMAELLTGVPLFPGESGVDQLVEIIKVLGTPTREEIQYMNPNYTEFKFPQIRGQPWSKVLRSRPNVCPEAIDLLVNMLQYTPTRRLRAIDALTHPFFEELRLPTTTLPSGLPLPPLFNFTPIEWLHHYDVCSRVLPPHMGPPPPPSST
eukprot:gnl/Hemi2/20523_TR6811_c0_g1_i1.p1 gnl/Hemi2/20523_TR6811_c0_g1~~gnl/Hemi2/20523_TR6811_c0_g1_i1.p1  ORF type:complete len:495 (-),score=55.73 gnl/Hemi2/20523_TR6811_c0_g1_i1:192-1676(-)